MQAPISPDQTTPHYESGQETEVYFRERQAQGDLTAFDAWLDASPAAAPMAGDELP